jgi:hypothetical protein
MIDMDQNSKSVFAIFMIIIEMITLVVIASIVILSIMLHVKGQGHLLTRDRELQESITHSLLTDADSDSDDSDIANFVNESYFKE